MCITKSALNLLLTCFVIYREPLYAEMKSIFRCCIYCGKEMLKRISYLNVLLSSNLQEFH